MYGISNVVGEIRLGGPFYWPMVLARTYWEHRELRNFMGSLLSQNMDLNLLERQRGAEYGCGYARMTPVLTEFCKEVTAFERDEELAAIAKEAFKPFGVVHRVASLEKVPQEDASLDLVLTYTVLQHMPDEEAQRVINEIRRTLAPNAYVFLVEDDFGPSGGGMWRRTPETYAKMLDMRLLVSTFRMFEDGRKNGNLMAFQK